VFHFDFAERISYADSRIGLAVDVELSAGSKPLTIHDVKIDTGASFCIFERGYAEALGLEIESGEPESVTLANGVTLHLFGHLLTITVGTHRSEGMVYFWSDERMTRCVLGRQGWLQSFRLCVIDYDREIYLSNRGD
jgi:hypothetical protein